MAMVEQGRLARVLAALATTGHVEDALRAYNDRDRAIELLADEVAIQRRQLSDELRAILRPHTRAAFSARPNHGVT
jgi:hypothetical protein